MSGKAGCVSEETVTSWKERLPTILSGYSPENILTGMRQGNFVKHFQTDL